MGNRLMIATLYRYCLFNLEGPVFFNKSFKLSKTYSVFMPPGNNEGQNVHPVMAVDGYRLKHRFGTIIASYLKKE